MELYIAADVVPAGMAEFAVIAVDGWFQGHTIASGPSGYAWPTFHHKASGFVPQNCSGNPVGGVRQHVGTADSDCLNRHLDLSRCRLIHWPFHQSYTTWFD